LLDETVRVTKAMAERDDIPLYGTEGLLGFLEERGDDPAVRVRLQDGRSVRLDPGLVERRADGALFAPLSLAELSPGDPERIAVAREQVTVDTRARPRGAVVVRVVPHTREETVAVETVQERAEITRVPVNRIVKEPPPVREEGDTTIIPVLEEVVVVEKGLAVREEIHITRRRESRRHEQRVQVRSERAEIERVDDGSSKSKQRTNSGQRGER
jgi:hypothetical protein